MTLEEDMRRRADVLDFKTDEAVSAALLRNGADRIAQLEHDRRSLDKWSEERIEHIRAIESENAELRERLARVEAVRDEHDRDTVDGHKFITNLSAALSADHPPVAPPLTEQELARSVAECEELRILRGELARLRESLAHAEQAVVVLRRCFRLVNLRTTQTFLPQLHHADAADLLLDWLREDARRTTPGDTVCRFCGGHYRDHADVRGSSAPVPKVPCLMLKERFAAAEPQKGP